MPAASSVTGAGHGWRPGMAVALLSVLLVATTGCTKTPAPKSAETRVSVQASKDSTVTFAGATLFLPANSIDRDTTVRIAKATQTPPDGAPVEGFDFDIGDAKITAPLRLTLPIIEEPAVGPDGKTLVPYLSAGQWGTEVAQYDHDTKTVTLTVTHLSWYGDLANLMYQGLRKLLAEWLAHFRASKPSCSSGGPQLRYPLASMLEPPVLACLNGSNDQGTLKVANNRGFYLMLNPQRGLTIHNVQVDGVLDTVTSSGGAVIRYLAQWKSLPLPPGATAEFTYQAVAGGPTLSFEPDQAATFVSAVLSLFSGISDPGSVWLWVTGCVRGHLREGFRSWGNCVADALAMAADRNWVGPGQSVKVMGIAVSRSLLGLLSVVLRAIPAIDMAVESRDGGSASTIQINAAPQLSQPVTPTTGAPPTNKAPNPPVTPPAAANRFAIASYDRLAAGAAHAEWYQAWQDFAAASNTITRLAINVGDTRWAPGPIGVNTTLRLCRDSACTQLVGAWNAQVVNYGTTAVDTGDIPVQPGTTYFLRYDRPDSAHTWAVYFWGPGTYNNLSVSIYGYNR